MQRSIGNRNVSSLQNEQPVVQAKLKIGQPDDAYEREADRVAEEVVRTPAKSATVEGVSEPGIQRKCAACEQEEELSIRRKPQSGETGNGAAAADHSVSGLLPGSGRPLQQAERKFFESRFGQDFSNVRIHTGNQALLAAQSLNARAFTVGNHIAFGAGEYNPESVAGKKLLAHELTHTVQQQKTTAVVVQRQELQRRFVDNSGGGRTIYVETADPELQPDGTYTETVLREELMPATDGHGVYPYPDREVELVFNPNTCQVEIPYRFNFEAQAAASPDAPWICQDPPSSEAVPDIEPDRLREIAGRYVAFVNFGLNHWFSLHIDDCDHPCADRHIPIVVRASIDSANPHRTIGVVNRGGRGDENTLCAGDFDYPFAVHEGGHQVLGANDEYLETDERVLERNPEAGRPERVRNDHSWMGSNDDFASFHERHFRFAQVFLEAVLAQTESGCNVSMKRLRTWG